ncbi:hypothetical protein TIFTF001_027439 [Ficus carica]|uniref:Uncharacterized protein n=1 Tax=Ficus carica TaxID=3494 RepID=A0AA88IV47_FICCA|nr:hypothetical protein TIFTF001_027439 [Ficus carica]
MRFIRLVSTAVGHPPNILPIDTPTDFSTLASKLPVVTTRFLRLKCTSDGRFAGAACRGWVADVDQLLVRIQVRLV